MKRIRYTVSYVKKLRGWQIKRAGKALWADGVTPSIPYTFKLDAIRNGAARARAEWANSRGTDTLVLTELVVMGKGKRGVTDNRTYGRDPRRSKG